MGIIPCTIPNNGFFSLSDILCGKSTVVCVCVCRDFKKSISTTYKHNKGPKNRHPEHPSPSDSPRWISHASSWQRYSRTPLYARPFFKKKNYYYRFAICKYYCRSEFFFYLADHLHTLLYLYRTYTHTHTHTDIYRSPAVPANETSPHKPPSPSSSCFWGQV